MSYYVCLEEILCRFLIHKTSLQLNLGAFAQPSELGDEVQLLPERPQPWVEFVPAQELQGAFKDWGNDPRKILSYVTNPSRYSIHTVDPPLESYVKDRVVVVGDAVSYSARILEVQRR